MGVDTGCGHTIRSLRVGSSHVIFVILDMAQSGHVN